MERLWSRLLTTTSRSHSALFKNEFPPTNGADASDRNYNEVIGSCTCFAKPLLISFESIQHAVSRKCGLWRWRERRWINMLFLACLSCSSNADFQQLDSSLFLAMRAWTSEISADGHGSKWSDDQDDIPVDSSSLNACVRQIPFLFGKEELEEVVMDGSGLRKIEPEHVRWKRMGLLQEGREGLKKKNKIHVAGPERASNEVSESICYEKGRIERRGKGNWEIGVGWGSNNL